MAAVGVSVCGHKASPVCVSSGVDRSYLAGPLAHKGLQIWALEIIPK